MQQQIQWILWGGALLLQLLVIRELLRGYYRKMPFLFLYAVGVFLSTVVAMAAYFDFGRWTSRTASYYWLLEALLTLLVFGMLISFIYQITAGRPGSFLLRVMLIAGSLLFAIVSIVVHYTGLAWLNRWMTNVTRDISFGAVILNLLLWTGIDSRKQRLLLGISAGLGIQMAGDAIGHSLRQMSRATVIPGDFVLAAANPLCFYTWWRALVRERTVTASQAKPATELPPG